MIDRERRVRTVAAAGLALVLPVVLLSAAIRLGQAATPPLGPDAAFALRAIHRTAASLEVLVVLWLFWLSWSERSARPVFALGAALALVLTIFLSLLGIAAGQSPPPAAALGNLLGGLALAANFAWLAGRSGASAVATPARMVTLGTVLLALQFLLGGRLAIFAGAGGSPALPVHAMLGLVLTAGLCWLVLRGGRQAWRAARMTLVLIVPVAGFTALQFEYSRVAAFSHAGVAALLVAAVAYLHGRFA